MTADLIYINKLTTTTKFLRVKNFENRKQSSTCEPLLSVERIDDCFLFLKGRLN